MFFSSYQTLIVKDYLKRIRIGHCYLPGFTSVLYVTDSVFDVTYSWGADEAAVTFPLLGHGPH